MTVRELLEALHGKDLDGVVRLTQDPMCSHGSVYKIMDVLPKDDRGYVWIDIMRIKWQK